MASRATLVDRLTLAWHLAGVVSLLLLLLAFLLGTGHAAALRSLVQPVTVTGPTPHDSLDPGPPLAPTDGPAPWAAPVRPAPIAS